MLRPAFRCRGQPFDCAQGGLLVGPGEYDRGLGAPSSPSEGGTGPLRAILIASPAAKAARAAAALCSPKSHRLLRSDKAATASRP